MSEQNLAASVIIYAGRSTAEKACRTLNDLQEPGRLQIDSAAIVYLQESGKLTLVAKRPGGLDKGLSGDMDLKPETGVHLEKLIAERDHANAIQRLLDIAEGEA